MQVSALYKRTTNLNYIDIDRCRFVFEKPARMSFNADTQKSFIYLQEVEEVAQEILTDKQTKLELVNAENKTREAYRALQNIEDRQAFLKVGEIYIQLPKQDCRELLKDGLSLLVLVVGVMHCFFFFFRD